VSKDYEFGKELYKMFSRIGICTMRAAFKDALTKANGRIDALPDALRGWFDHYVSGTAHLGVTDHRFFKSLRKHSGLRLTELSVMCPQCNGTGKQPATPSGHVPKCYRCAQTGKVTRWALS
jgi:hypothetical protein